MKLKLLLISLILTLSACASDPVVIEKSKPVAPMPTPLATYNSSWLVKEVDGKPFVGMEYNEFMLYKMWSNDLFRYVHDLKSLVCYYSDDCTTTEVNKTEENSGTN